MLRELIAWVLNNYLGKYVENLNTAQLSVALLSGEVELENLPLRRDALRHLGLPLKILSGSIGKIKLQIPVRSFRTAPWCIQIERIYLVCGPLNLDEWDTNQELKADLDYKLGSLDNLEARWRANLEAGAAGNYYTSSYSGWLNYGSSLVTNIVENLQLKINEVHFRYEDTLTVENCRFACGMTIGSLSAESCSENWVPGFTTNQHISFKLVQLNEFSFYWDPLIRDETLSETNSSDLADVINHVKWNHEYVVSPVSAQAKFKRERSENPLRTRNRPRLVCDLEWNEIAISLSDNQYRQMIECVRGLDDISKYRRCRLLRPLKPISEDRRAWWLYAIRCHGLLKRFDCDSSNLAKENLGYIKMYTRMLGNPNETLTLEQKELREHVESDRSYEELKVLREISMMNQPIAGKRAENTPKGRSMLLQWFPQMWYGNTETRDEGVESPTMTNEQITFEDEILNALADTVENNSIFKRDAVFGKFEFRLQKGTLDICSGGFGSETVPMLQLQFENLILNLESRPRSGSYFIGLSLGSILVKDRITPNSEFPDLIKPQLKEELPIKAKAQKPKLPENEPLFVLEYEKKPLALIADYRLLIKSQSLDIVYNIGAARWFMDFVSKPHQLSEARKTIEAMKMKTKKEIMKNWENILEGHLSERKTWAFEIDISAPQIIFAENFSDKQGSSIVVVDFGRLQLTNNVLAQRTNGKQNGIHNSTQNAKDSDDEDMFVTPCSTPPGSSSSPTLVSATSDPSDTIPNMESLNETNFLDKLYEKYNLDLTDLQVLVCKGKERWNFASSKGTSTLHVLDRFNITLQIERRIFHTSDPQYPSLTLQGRLPRLNVHVNEYKIAALTDMLNVIASKSKIESPIKVNATPVADLTAAELSQEDSLKDDSIRTSQNKLVIMQFSIDQMSLEVQSRGRSIAELQVTGVRAGLTQRSCETNISLSVHGLLLVDAIQSFGPDFELLIASHRHVGMDSVSGSLRHSEPCSPISPGSPDPNQEERRPTSPMTIHKALSSLTRASSPFNSSIAAVDDIDALIVVEIQLISVDDDDLLASEDLENHQLANIQFNNLDIIANQETIVELIGFANRVFPKTNSRRKSAVAVVKTEEEIAEAIAGSKIKTEITFDFHRLNILILRALMRDNYLVARKVGTLTLCEAKINATLSETVEVTGSLGGLQVLDLTPEGVNHQRVLSVGKDPLTDPAPIDGTHEDLVTTLSHEVYGGSSAEKSDRKERQALSFSITRDLNACIDIKIRMASVWYIHCARFLQELTWCATEFKHYFRSFARSIKEKAADMALGLVQPRSDSISTPFKSAPDVNNPFNSPRHSRRLRTYSINKTQELLAAIKYEIKLDVILETPVLVVPRSSSSTQVFVAHLGQISITNCDKENTIANDMTSIKSDVIETQSVMNDVTADGEDSELFDLELENCDETRSIGSCTKIESITSLDNYEIDIKNMNLFSLDTTNRKGFRLSALPRAEEFYSCQEDAIPILHDTAIRLEITRELERSFGLLTESPGKDVLNITGTVVKPLRVSLTRQSYEQLLETIDNIFKVPPDLVRPPSENPQVLKQIDEELETAANFEETAFKRRLFNQASISENKTALYPKVYFELPILIIELNNDKNDPLIEIALREFCINYVRKNLYETSIQVSLRSVQMEDLLRDMDSKQRVMVTSTTSDGSEQRFYTSCASHSCPDLIALMHPRAEDLGCSLPDKLDAGFTFCAHQHKPFGRAAVCPDTPPPSPQLRSREDNLVIYNSTLVEPDSPNFATEFNSLRQSSSIDFNSLDLIISVQSWFILLNFFGLLNDDNTEQKAATKLDVEDQIQISDNTKLEVSVRSLNLVLMNDEYEMAKANVSNAQFLVAKHELDKVVEGKLGSIYLNDLTPHGSIYKERFVTSGNEALNFVYKRVTTEKGALDPDSTLKIQMSSVRYVHTKRFVAEIQKFFRDFSQLQTPVMRKIKTSDSLYNLQQRSMKLGLEINAGSPIIILPLCARSDQLIVGDLGEFSLNNSFYLTGDLGIISKQTHTSDLKELLDVMTVYLVHTDIFTGFRSPKNDETYKSDVRTYALDMGSYFVVKNGPSLLKDKCHLTLQVERNLDTWRSRNVPDISVQGTLSRLEAVLDLEQYKLIRGFLNFNLGETIDDLYQEQLPIFDSRMSLLVQPEPKTDENVFTNLSITLELQDVSVKLHLPPPLPPHPVYAGVTVEDYDRCRTKSFTAPLACINFIKSTLIVDSFSDGSQDIDLVSKEILIKDSRLFPGNEANLTGKNVFNTILQPINFKSGTDLVQAEVHSRKRNDCTKFTILLNNMRLMAILDWLETVRDYLAQMAEPPKETLVFAQTRLDTNADPGSCGTLVDNLELKLNITDSELVVVENANQWDTNAVILKSTTVVSYRPADIAKIMSLNLNNLEVFSCILGLEEETALSIIDPVTINLDLRKGILDAQMQKQLVIRLSYHDVKMFSRIFQSLSRQLQNAQNLSTNQVEPPPVTNPAIEKLISLGFNIKDCHTALEVSRNQLDEAALWLTQNAEPAGVISVSGGNALDITEIEVKAHCISITVIDDCKDADVPLIEISLSNIYLRQELGGKEVLTAPGLGLIAKHVIVPGKFRAGQLKAIIGSDYYNRALSGYEPLIEPWRCDAQWSYSYGHLRAQDDRLHVKLNSSEILRCNLTSSAIELFKMVRENWTQDYYASETEKPTSPTGSYRRRAPFIPFALKNDTGIRMWYSKLVATPGSVNMPGSSRFDQGKWTLIEPGALVHFSFGPSTKQRHQEAHKLNLHQIAVRVEGYNEVGPVSVDKVGIYFRSARPDITDGRPARLPRARITFAVSMEGSAQKLITVRSALRLVNHLDNPILLKMENRFGHLDITEWPETKTVIVNSGEKFNVPLSHTHAFLYVKPLTATLDVNNMQQTSKPNEKGEERFQFDANEYWSKNENRISRTISNANMYQFADKGIQWESTQTPGDVTQEYRHCAANRDRFYRFVVAIRKQVFPINERLVPGHTITLNPPLRVHNLLPCDLLYKMPSTLEGRVAQSQTASVYEIDPEKSLELYITLDGYPGSGMLSIPTFNVGEYETELKLTDTLKRVLLLNVLITMIRGEGVQIYISAPFWFINKTALPLIYKQQGAALESAGQFEENEQARMISPFIFSYSEKDQHHCLLVRLGKRYGMHTTWGAPLVLHKQTQNCHLSSGHSSETFVIGIEVRRGRGKYAHKTCVVTFSPHFQFYNRTSYKLQFAQTIFANTLTDPLSRQTFIDALPGSHVPFHWPRPDKEQKMCMRMPDIKDCLWSGGVPIIENLSLYINIRNMDSAMHFIRMETVLQGATFFLVFTNAESLPPPIRIDNYSDVPIKFYQPMARHQLKSNIRPRSAMSYVLDEPEGKAILQIEAPGGDTCQCPLTGFPVQRLTYENFIYIAFSQTFENIPTYENDITNYDVKASQLVLGVIDRRVVLVKKQPGDRSQLWRMNNERQMEHEGSSPPSEPGKPGQQRLVLDLERPPQPFSYVNLIVAPINPQRKSSQTWKFTDDGRLMCDFSNMCVQARGGFYGLRPGVDVVLGMIVNEAKVVNRLGVPFEQAIERQKLRPGSGCLSVKFMMDGPIKTVEIKDVKSMTSVNLEFDPAWKHVSRNIPNSNTLQGTQTMMSKSVSELHISLDLEYGLGLSLVSSHPCEELAYISIVQIAMECIATANESTFNLSIGDLQIDNQLLESPCPVMMYTSNEEPGASAMNVTIKMLPSPNKNAVIFDHFLVSVKPMQVNLDERLLLRLVDFFELVEAAPNAITLRDETDYEAQRVITDVLATNATRYYFGDLQLLPTSIRLSVATANKLTPKMIETKKALGLSVIFKFEDAIINLEKFTDHQHFETLETYWKAIVSHYLREIKLQLVTILGSVDFLGNPLGLVYDLTDGFSGLIFEGSVTSLVKNVTHGLSNSTAKITESISDVLGNVVLDEQYTEARQRILEDAASSGNSTGDHLMAGLKGFGFGILGGVTSVFKHTYSGARSDGLQGLVAGFGKGLVGTVTKPVIGVLDLASETANAVRETSKSSNRYQPSRKRLPRCVTGGPGGLLPPYSTKHSEGQQNLYNLNRRNFNEQFMAYEPQLYDSRDPEQKLRLLVSSENVWIFSMTKENLSVIYSKHLSEIRACKVSDGRSGDNSKPNSKKTMRYIELELMNSSSTSGVKCQNEKMAQLACRHINYAKSVFDEKEQTLTTDPSSDFL